ncbi:MAG: polyprenyl synthetase family protein [Prevotella sp.]|jgi:geranylgeranyl diphosphate synthase type II|nr:polyprenyl synthetase family protein [Prevotella sp.]
MLYNFDDILSIVNRDINSLKFGRRPASLFEPVSYILSLGGKRVRPALCLMAYNLYKDDVETALPVASAIEIFHNFTLLHDDLMDRAEVRRGKATVHVKWNENAAVLSGDAMLIEAYVKIADVNAKFLQPALKLFSATATEICCGQQLDMEFEQRADVTIDEYMEMIRLKTAVLLGCALKEGAILAEASAEDAENLYNFGINIGLGFQLMDDLLDVYGNAETFGKKIGGDILCNKKTFLLIHALHHADTRDELLSWLNRKDFDPDEKIKAVTRIYDVLGLKEVTQAEAIEYYNRGIACLDKVNVDAAQKNELKSFAELLLLRNS